MFESLIVLLFVAISFFAGMKEQESRQLDKVIKDKYGDCDVFIKQGKQCIKKESKKITI